MSLLLLKAPLVFGYHLGQAGKITASH